ncbi:hypothetical protein [Streptomyces sp. NPDC050804]|uniref:hypothetical protein n=1 Tax=Streptomyces sp. NPDC050804 TaxID=3154745 RepID=UPI00341673E7
MLPEDLRAIAAEAGIAVVETAGTEHWISFGRQVASWLAQGGGQVERTQLARLTKTATALRTATDAYSPSIAARHALDWQIHFTDALERLSAEARGPAAECLRRLVRDHPAGSTRPSPAPGAITGENIRIQADHNSFAANVVNGDVHMASPSVPDPAQG